jgi:hypothetical protein
MDEWTETHLDSFIAWHISANRKDLRQHFKKYAVRRWEEEPVYWNSKGWAVMLENFLKLAPKDWYL